MRKLLLTIFLLLINNFCYAACQTGVFPGLETEQTHKYFVCDTVAELPTSGLVIGDLLYALDTEKLYVSNSTTTYTTNSSKPSADDQIRISDSATDVNWRNINDCTGAGKALTYTAATNTIGCNTITGGAGITLDLGDDSGNDSVAIGEIATTGDTNSIVSEPSADKALFTMSNDWPKADTADDLTCTNCINATEIDGGALEGEIEAVADIQDLQGAATDAQIPDAITASNYLPLAGGTMTGAAVLAAGTTSLSPLKFTSGTNLTTAIAGGFEYDGKVIYSSAAGSERGVSPSAMFRVLQADATGTDTSNAQPWFPTTGAVTLQGSTAYHFEGEFSSVRSAGTTSHTTGISFAGTASLTAIGYHVEVKEGDAATISDSDLIAIQVATDVNIKAASTSASENIVFQVWGTVWINAGGTFIPTFKYSAAPGGAPTIEKGTYFLIYPIGSNTVTTVGPWS